MLDAVSNEVVIHMVGAETWSAFGDRVLPHIQKMAAGSGGRYLPHDIIQAIFEGRFQLFLALEGPEILCAMITEIIKYPQMKVMRIIFLVGHRHQRWVRHAYKIENLARTVFACERMEAFHQFGHERLLQHTPGWSQWHIMSEKVL